MTANAFTSVSLHPPLVLVSIDHRARMHALLPDDAPLRRVGAGRPTRSGIALHFAGRPMDEPGELFEWTGDVPLVRGRDRPRRPARCAPSTTAPATTRSTSARSSSLAERAGEPLLFHRGAFGTMSREPALAERWGW